MRRRWPRHFSKAKGDAVTEVDHAERRYVRKPRGAAAGSVRILEHKTLRLRVEAERVRELLAAEVSFA